MRLHARNKRLIDRFVILWIKKWYIKLRWSHFKSDRFTRHFIFYVKINKKKKRYSVGNYVGDRNRGCRETDATFRAVKGVEKIAARSRFRVAYYVDDTRVATHAELAKIGERSRAFPRECHKHQKVGIATRGCRRRRRRPSSFSYSAKLHGNFTGAFWRYTRWSPTRLALALQAYFSTAVFFPPPESFPTCSGGGASPWGKS